MPMASFPRPASFMSRVFLHSLPRSYPLNLSLTMSPKLGLPRFWGMDTPSFMQFASPSSCFSLQETSIFGSNNLMAVRKDALVSLLGSCPVFPCWNPLWSFPLVAWSHQISDEWTQPLCSWWLLLSTWL